MTATKSAPEPNLAHGMREWAVVRVSAECPFCGCENEIKTDELTDEEIWDSEYTPFEHECEECHRYFWIEVDDDDR